MTEEELEDHVRNDRLDELCNEIKRLQDAFADWFHPEFGHYYFEQEEYQIEIRRLKEDNTRLSSAILAASQALNTNGIKYAQDLLNETSQWIARPVKEDTNE